MTTTRKTTKKTSRPTMTAEQRQERAAALQASIAEQVEALRGSDEWTAFLDYLGSFHGYSLNNVLLMLAQRPSATNVAGFQQWKEKGRQVRKGQSGMKIFGFSTKKITDEEAAQRGGRVERNAKGEPFIRTFPMLTVFDQEQTDPIDGAADTSTMAHHLTGEDGEQITERVTGWLIEAGWSVDYGELDGPNGLTLRDDSRRVLIQTGLSPAQTAKTMIHEAAHVLLHSELEESDEERVEHRGTKETEAESVAYVLGNLLGLDTSAYSIGYVAGWSKGDADTIRASAANVLRAVHTLADALAPVEAGELVTVGLNATNTASR